MQICLADSGKVVVSDLRWARSAAERARGLIGAAPLPPGSALAFEPARQIHTFGMRFPLDVVFCDSGWQVVHVVRSMVPRRVTRPVWRSRFVLELTGGTLSADVSVGDSLELVP